MAKLKAKDSIFPWIFNVLYYEWFRKLEFHMIKYVAQKHFGLNIQQSLDENADLSNYFDPIAKQIAEHIVQKYLMYNLNEINL